MTTVLGFSVDPVDPAQFSISIKVRTLLRRALGRAPTVIQATNQATTADIKSGVISGNELISWDETIVL